MKSLAEYIAEEAEGAATPANTMGMGNLMLPDGDQMGTEGVPADPSNSKNKKPRKAKSKKEKKEDSVTRTDEELIFPWRMS